MTKTTTQTAFECPLCFGEGEHNHACDLSHMDHAPAAPTVHLNGSGFKNLYAAYDKALDAIRDAIKAHREAAPNGRDYYVQAEPNALHRAQDEHAARERRLREVQGELEFILMNISEQPDYILD